MRNDINDFAKEVLGVCKGYGFDKEELADFESFTDSIWATNFLLKEIGKKFIEILGEYDVESAEEVREELLSNLEAEEDEVERMNDLRSYYVTQIVRMRAEFEQEEIEKEDLNEEDWSIEEIMEEYNRLTALDNTYEENYM